MKASMLAKAGPTGPPVGPSPKHRPLGPTGGSPLRAATPSSAAPPAPPAPAASEDDDVSDYTDADESISAPTEFLAEFLSAIMGKDYPTALKYCKLILQYEPNNRTAREFYPLIVEKLVQSTIDEDLSNSEDDSSSGGSGSMTGSDEDDDSDLSVDEEEDEEGEDDDKDGCGLGAVRRRHEHNDNSSVEFGDTDGTTASYSSLEDEEADPTDICRDTITAANDNEDVGNGNEVPGDAETLAALIQTTRFSDSESPTEPVSQRLISGLRAKVIPTRR